MDRGGSWTRLGSVVVKSKAIHINFVGKFVSDLGTIIDQHRARERVTERLLFFSGQDEDGRTMDGEAHGSMELAFGHCIASKLAIE